MSTGHTDRSRVDVVDLDLRDAGRDVGSTTSTRTGRRRPVVLRGCVG